MRVVFLTITFDPEPGASRGLPLAKWLAAKGYDIRVLTGFPQYPEGRVYPGYRMRPWQREVMAGIPVFRVPLYPSHDTSAMRRMGTYLSFMLSASTIGAAGIGPADIVYLYEPPPTSGLASFVLKLFRGTPIVHHIADMWPETVIASGMVRGKLLGRFANYLLGGWSKFLYRQASVITVLSPGFKRLLVERGVPAQKVELIYNWADEATFRPIERDRELARDLGFEGKFNIVYAGNMGPLQGLDHVLEAAALLRDHPQLQVILAGTGPKEAELRRKAQELGLSNVRFIARRQYWEMPSINALADVLLVHLRDLPFLRATIPGKVQVAMASSLPVLLAVGGDAADLVRAARAGLVTPPENPRALADAMMAMSRLPNEALREMGDNGRRYYLENLSLEVAGEKMDKIFRRVDSMRRRARGSRPVGAEGQGAVGVVPPGKF
jgi:putative colanic acid biosynthesis glycosyltransferase WcaI